MKNKQGLFSGKRFFPLGFAAMFFAAVFSITFTACNDGGGDDAPKVTGVTVTAAAESVIKGGTLQFFASVTGENSPAQTVTWTIAASGIASGTSISDSGLLTVAAGETSTTLTVKATSTEDASKFAAKIVTVTASSVSSGSIEMVSIPGGTFTMGSPSSEPGRNSDETQHNVTVSSFYMSKYLITQAQYRTLIGTNPSYFPGNDNRPVDRVTWYDAVEFANRLSRAEGLTPAYTISGTNVTWNRSANGYRLPTEAEWEYAARGGAGSPGNYLYAGSDTIEDSAWYGSNSSYTTHPVGTKAPNGLGLYDMSGNLWEWCWDLYGDYPDTAQTNPAGAVSGVDRVLRGGSWYHSASDARNANRNYAIPSDQSSGPSNRYNGCGFRLVRSGI
jgi:formylglycine-generating enzyme required for sulfatase activity